MSKQIAEELNDKLQAKSSLEVLKYFLAEYKGKVVQATSMGVEDQVITQMISQIEKGTRIVTLDTGRLFQETHDLIQRTIEEYAVNIEVFFPDLRKVEEMTNKHGSNLFYKSVENRKMCCRIRKDESIKRALAGEAVWICGLRKDQTVTRFFNKLVEWDTQHELIKLNPLISWTEKQVWDYVRENDIPYNVLHDKNYPA